MSGHHGLAMTMAVFLFHLKLVHGDGPLLATSTAAPSTAAPSTAAPSTAAPSTDLQVVQVESKNVPGKFLWAESTEEGSSVQVTEIKDEWRLHPGNSPGSYYLECVRAGKYLTHTGNSPIPTVISSEKSAESLWYLHGQADGSVALEQASPSSEDFKWLHFNANPPYPRSVTVYWLNAGGYFNFLTSDGQPITLVPSTAAPSTAAPSTAAPSTAAPSTDLQVVQVESKNVPGKFLRAESTEEGSSVQVSEIKDEWRLHPGPSPKSYYLECVRAGKYLTHTGSHPIPTFISSDPSDKSLWYLHGQADGSVALEQASPSSEEFKWLHFNANPPYPRSVTVYWLNAGGYFNLISAPSISSCGPSGAVVRIPWMLLVVGIFADR